MVDFHMHSIYSDGTDDIITILNKVNNLDYFSITDHDSIESARYIMKNGLDRPNYVTGVELSTRDLGDSVHILFYNYDVDNKALDEIIDEIDMIRMKRLKERLSYLEKDFNIKLKNEDLTYLYSLSNPTKPNIATILVKDGYASDVSVAIKKYLYHKLETKKLDSIYVLDKLKNEKGILVLAHPLGGIGEVRIDKEKFIDRLNRFKSHGLKGLECVYSLYNSEEQKFLIDNAKRNNLIISGGSDYHGLNKKVQIGELSCDNNTNYEYITLKNYIQK